MSVIRKVSPFLLRDSRGFLAYLGPRPRPYSLGFRRGPWWAAEPDYPPTTCSGSPARQLITWRLSEESVGTGAGRGSWSVRGVMTRMSVVEAL